MKKNKLIKRLIYALLTAIIAVLIIVGFASNTVFINLEYEDQIMVGEATKIDMTTKKGANYHNPDSVNIEIYNKYNKNARIETELTPYIEGHYSIVLTPNYTGEYIVNIEVVDGSETYTKSESFTVQ